MAYAYKTSQEKRINTLLRFKSDIFNVKTILNKVCNCFGSFKG